MTPTSSHIRITIQPLRTLAEFKRRLETESHWHVRYSHAPSVWQSRVVVKRQTNAVAFAKSFDPAIIKACEERPHANASWHWWGKASNYKPSPNVETALRVLIGTAWEDPHAGWMEYRPAGSDLSVMPHTQEGEAHV